MIDLLVYFVAMYCCDYADLINTKGIGSATLQYQKQDTIISCVLFMTLVNNFLSAGFSLTHCRFDHNLVWCNQLVHAVVCQAFHSCVFAGVSSCLIAY